MTRLVKVSGSGNDFVALIEPERAPTSAEIVAWCARGVSIGADGLFVLSRDAGRVRMDYWNSDGQPADLCVNGSRCAARLAFELGWAEQETTVLTGAGALRARRVGTDSIALELPRPDSLPRLVVVPVPPRAVERWYVSTGVPHFVVPWPEGLAGCPVAELGSKLRRHEAFGAAGANVDFARFPDPHRMEVRIVPHLQFKYDPSVERGARISQLIDQAVADDARRKKRRKK